MQYRIKFGLSLTALLLAAGCSSGSGSPASGSGEVVSVSSSALATTNDLTVGYIQRLPVMNWVTNSTNPSVDGWPTVGQSVTWRGYVRNFSSSARNGVQYQWQWDGVQVATGSVNIAANGTATVDYVRGWDFSRHNLTLVIDTGNAVSEDEEGNNSLTVVSNALSLGVWVEQSSYNYFLAHQRDLTGVHSTCWDNWIQRQVSSWNTNLYAGAVFPETPQGVLDRVRLDKIVIVADGTLPLNGGLATNDPDLNDHTVDLEWGFPANELPPGSTAYADTTTVSTSNAFYYEQSLPHELGHARYLIDDYGFNVHQQPDGMGRDGIPQIENGATIVGSPFLPMVSSDAVYYSHQSGLMNGDDYLHMDRYSATALNLITGHRATQGNVNAPGNIGVFLNDLPSQNQVTLTDAATSLPLAGAQVSVYQSTAGNQLYAKNFSATPSQTLTADGSGKILLGHNPFTSGSLAWTHGSTDIMLRIQQQSTVRYMFMEASDFNLEFWRGHTTLGTYALSVAFQPGAVVSSGPPDLVVTSASYSPSTVAPGQPMTFTATVKNQGLGATPAGTIIGVSFKVDGTQVSWSDTDTQSLAPGASVTLTANSGPGGSSTWPATYGAHTLLAWVDDVNRMAESDETNNQLSTPFTVGSDLVVTQVSYSPTTASPGTPITFSATVKNVGSQATPAGTITGVSFNVDGTQVSWSDTFTQSLAPGASVTLTSNNGPQGHSTWTATSGAHTVQAWVDDVNRIAEGNENNNKLLSPLSIGIDLTVTSLTASPASPNSGNPVAFSAVVTNVGTTATPAGTIIGVRFDVDGTAVSWSDTDTQSLAPGASVTLTANSGPSGSSTWTATSGSHTVQAWADDVNRLNDVNRNNNKLTSSLTVH